MAYLTYLPFYWSRIMPISYSNYLSETEILEAMRAKVDELAEAVNLIEEFLEKNLDEKIREEVRKEVSRLLVSLQAELDAIKDEVSELEQDLDKKYNYLLTLIDGLDGKVDAELADLKEYVDRRDQMLESKMEIADENLKRMVDLLDAKVDAGMARTIRMLADMHRSIIRWVRNYFDRLSKTTIMVTNPFTGMEDILQNVIDAIALQNACTLTADEYAALGLTADAYAALGLTAFEYMFYGIDGKCGKGSGKPLYRDIMYRERTEPVGSAFLLTDGAPPEDNYDLTADQYAKVSQMRTAYEIDRRGRYWLANQGSAVYRDCIHLRADTATADNQGINHLSVLLSPDIDVADGSIPTADLLTDNSVDKMILDVRVEAPNYGQGTWQYTVKGTSLVQGGIAVDLDVWNSAKTGGGSNATLLIDVTALTTTY